MNVLKHGSRPTWGRLSGSVAIVTGGDSPLSRAIGLCLAYQGAAVVLAFHDEDLGADETLRRIRTTGGEMVALSGAIEAPAFAQQVADVALSELGFEVGPQQLQQPAIQSTQGSNSGAWTQTSVTQFAKEVASRLAVRRVRMRPVVPGPIWTPLVATGAMGATPVNQQAGSSEPCFVFIASRASMSSLNPSQ